MAKEALSVEFLSLLWKEYLAETQNSLKNFLEECSPLKLEDERLLIATPNRFLCDFLKKPDRLEQIVESLRNYLNNQKLEVCLIVEGNEPPATPTPEPEIAPEVSPTKEKEPAPSLAPTKEEATPPSAPQINSRSPLESNWKSNLQTNLLFDNFVKSSNNSLAAATAQAVAQSPGKIYNPLFFYSGVGLGKTHLINAIGNHIVSHNPQLKVLYTSAEQFTNEFVESLRSNQQQQFRDKFRNVDVLLIDDIHFIVNKEGIQEELFQTMDSLRRTDHQIVISSDCPPRQMNAVMNRLRSRFEWGMIADIQPPDFETRVAILSQKATSLEISIPDEVLEYIASEFHSNIRELEGALIRVITYCNIYKLELTASSATQALESLLDHSKDKKIDVELIKKVVCEYFNISEDDLVGPRREQRVVRPRQLAMYLCKELIPGASYPEIGAYFGGRDHTTVIHAYRKVESNLNEIFYKTSLNNLRERLK